MPGINALGFPRWDNTALAGCWEGFGAEAKTKALVKSVGGKIKFNKQIPKGLKRGIVLEWPITQEKTAQSIAIISQAGLFHFIKLWVHIKKNAENSTIILGSALLPQPLHTTKLLWEMMNNPAVGWASSCTGTKRANAKGMEDSQDQHEGMHFKHVFKKLEIKNLMLWHCCPALRSHTCSLPVGQQQSISNTSPMLTLKSHTGAQQ